MGKAERNERNTSMAESGLSCSGVRLELDLRQRKPLRGKEHPQSSYPVEKRKLTMQYRFCLKRRKDMWLI